MIDRDVFDGTCGHARKQGVRWLLDNRGATAQLDREQTRRAIVERTRQDDADDAAAVETCRRSKEWIDRGAMAVLARAARQVYLAIDDQHVLIGWCYIDIARLDVLAMLRMGGLQAARAAENARQHARTARWQVQHDKQCGWQIAR